MENLKLLRSKYGYNQEKLAALVGVSRSTIAMWETGKSQPDNESLLKLSEVFNVSIDFLLGNKKEHAAKSDMPSPDELKFALFGGSDVTDEQFEEVKRFAEYVRQRDKK